MIEWLPTAFERAKPTYKCVYWEAGLLCCLKRGHLGEHDLRRGGNDDA